MFRNTYQHGTFTILFGGGANPLKIWDSCTKNGYISRFIDRDIQSMVFELGGTNVSTTYIVCPKGKQVLGLSMPFLVMIVKNLKKYFSFEVTIMDESDTRRRFRVSNFQSTTQIMPLCTVMPICLSDGWNQIQFNLAEFTQRAYKKQFKEVHNLKVNANIRLRRIYFCERLLLEDELPADYKLYFPISSKRGPIRRNEIENFKTESLVTPPIGEKKSSKTGLKTSSQPSIYSARLVPEVATPETPVQPTIAEKKSSKGVLRPASKASSIYSANVIIGEANIEVSTADEPTEVEIIEHLPVVDEIDNAETAEAEGSEVIEPTETQAEKFEVTAEALADTFAHEGRVKEAIPEATTEGEVATEGAPEAPQNKNPVEGPIAGIPVE